MKFREAAAVMDEVCEMFVQNHPSLELLVRALGRVQHFEADVHVCFNHRDWLDDIIIERDALIASESGYAILEDGKVIDIDEALKLLCGRMHQLAALVVLLEEEFPSDPDEEKPFPKCVSQPSTGPPSSLPISNGSKENSLCLSATTTCLSRASAFA